MKDFLKGLAYLLCLFIFTFIVWVIIYFCFAAILLLVCSILELTYSFSLSVKVFCIVAPLAALIFSICVCVREKKKDK